MHTDAMTAMRNMLVRYRGNTADVLDVGSYDVNGNYRELIEKEKGWNYSGLDITPGPNVDIVAIGPYDFPVLSATYDIVISGSVLEHVLDPWLWLPEVVRLLKPGGLLCIVTHHSFPLHRHPVDTFRYMPDGLEHLFDLTEELERYDIRLSTDQDIIGSAFKSRA